MKAWVDKTSCLALTWVICCLLFVPSSVEADHASLSVDKDHYLLDDVVYVTLRNEGTVDLIVDDPLLWEARDSSNNVVYASQGSATKRVKRIRPHQPETFSWRLAYRDGKKVPPGVYRVVVYVKGEKNPEAAFTVDSGQQGAKRTVSTASAGLLGLGGLLSAMPAIPTLAPFAVPLLVSQAGTVLLGVVCHAYASDPSDKDFQKDVSEIQFKASFSQPRSAFEQAANNYTESTLAIASIVTNLTRATEKYQGAVEAGDKGWAARHEKAARTFAAKISEMWPKYAGLSKEYARQIGLAAGPGSRLTTEDVQKLLSRVREGGLPREEVEFLKRAGLSDAEVGAIGRALLSARIEGTDDLQKAVDQVGGSLTDVARAFRVLADRGF